MDIEIEILAPNKVIATYVSIAEDGQENEPQILNLENDFTLVIDWIRGMTEINIASKFAAA